MDQHANAQLVNLEIHLQVVLAQSINVHRNDLASHRRFASMDAVSTNVMELFAVLALIAIQIPAVAFANHSS